MWSHPHRYCTGGRAGTKGSVVIIDTISWVAAAGVALILMFAVLLGNSIEAYRLKRLELRVARGWHALKDQHGNSMRHSTSWPNSNVSLQRNVASLRKKKRIFAGGGATNIVGRGRSDELANEWPRLPISCARWINEAHGSRRGRTARRVLCVC